MTSRRIIAITTESEAADIAAVVDNDLAHFGDTDATVWDDSVGFMLDMIEGAEAHALDIAALAKIADAVNVRLGRRGPIIDTADIATRLREPGWQQFDEDAVTRIIAHHGTADAAAAAIQASGAMSALDEQPEAENERVRAAIRHGITLVDTATSTAP